MSRFKRFIKWLLFGTIPATKPRGSLEKVQNPEKQNEFTIGRIDLIGSFLCNHLFGISNRTPSSFFEGETGQRIDVGDDAGDFAWCRADYLDADSDSYEIGGELTGYSNLSPIFDNDDYAFRVCGVNPANGLPMLDDCIDIHGNPYGTDFTDSCSTLLGDNSFDSLGDDGFGSSTSFDISDPVDPWVP